MNNERLTTNKKWRNNGRGTKEKDTLGIEPRTFSLQDPPACHEQRTTNEETKNDEQQNRFLLFNFSSTIFLRQSWVDTAACFAAVQKPLPGWCGCGGREVLRTKGESKLEMQLLKHHFSTPILSWHSCMFCSSPKTTLPVLPVLS